MNNKIYLFGEKEQKTGYIAFLNDEFKFSRKELVEYLKVNKQFPAEMYLKEYEVNKSSLKVRDEKVCTVDLWPELLKNQFAMMIFSEKFMKIIESLRTENDSYKWVEVIVVSDLEKKKYYVPIFDSLPDVLDLGITTYVTSDLILVPCFSIEKSINYSIFPIGRRGWECPSGLYITEKIKKIIQKSIVGTLSFEKCKTSSEGELIK